MSKTLAGILLALGSAVGVTAQSPSATFDTSAAAPPIDFANTSAARITLMEPAPPFASMATVPDATLSNAGPTPPAKPEPRFVFGGRDDFRWQLGLGIAWTRFRSSIFNASAVGLNTSLSYFTNDWFAVEGDVTATFAPDVLPGEAAKFVIYGIGPKIAWRQRRWEPWLHGLVGGIHEQPQLAGVGRNAFAVQLGGGADYRWMPRLGFRLQADYVRSGLFHQHQDNFQLVGGVVFHF
jgi:hypothetical protein